MEKINLNEYVVQKKIREVIDDCMVQCEDDQITFELEPQAKWRLEMGLYNSFLELLFMRTV